MKTNGQSQIPQEESIKIQPEATIFLGNENYTKGGDEETVTNDKVENLFLNSLKKRIKFPQAKTFFEIVEGEKNTRTKRKKREEILYKYYFQRVPAFVRFGHT
ncbi:MAG: hypothetical protein AABZ60_09640, partial [Planctomycetota bacterium]